MESTVRRHTLLVVDDDAPLRETVARRMRRAGYHVTTAETAEAALAYTEPGRPPFDVVITDVHMPQMNGIELAGILLERRPTQRIVIVTGDPDEALARAAIARGPVSYLLKPFELFELEAVVNQAVSAPRFSQSTVPMERNRTDATIGTVPAEWLLWVDDRSYAGVGHADRVARMARVIALALRPPFSALALAELEIAAWSHELGLLSGPTANPVELAWRSAEMLLECGSSDSIVRTVRHMYERWDGTGGPNGLRELEVPGSSQVLAVADAIDHYCAGWMQTGMQPEQAAERGVSLVVAMQGTCFNPEIARALQTSGESVRSIVGVARRPRTTDEGSKPVRELPFPVQQLAQVS